MRAKIVDALEFLGLVMLLNAAAVIVVAVMAVLCFGSVDDALRAGVVIAYALESGL